MQIKFEVPAVPIAQPRARATRVGKFVRMYEADGKHAIHSFKAAVQICAKQAYKGPPLTGPLTMSLVFVFPRGSNKIWKTRPMPRYVKATAPDADNLAKSCLDSMNKLTFADDGQVVSLYLAKWHAAGDEQPHVEVVITEID